METSDQCLNLKIESSATVTLQTTLLGYVFWTQNHDKQRTAHMTPVAGWVWEMYLVCREEQEVVRWVSYHIALGWRARRRRTRVAEPVQTDQQDTEVTQGEREQLPVLSAVLDKDRHI